MYCIGVTCMCVEDPRCGGIVNDPTLNVRRPLSVCLARIENIRSTRQLRYSMTASSNGRTWKKEVWHAEWSYVRAIRQMSGRFKFASADTAIVFILLYRDLLSRNGIFIVCSYSEEIGVQSVFRMRYYWKYHGVNNEKKKTQPV